MIGPEEERLYSAFIDYVEYYPDEDEEHAGERRGLRPDAPESAQKAYAEWLELQKEYERLGIKV